MLLNHSFQASVAMDTPVIVNFACKPLFAEHFSSLKRRTAWSYSSSCSKTFEGKLKVKAHFEFD